MERRQQSCVASSVRRNGIEVWYIMEVNLQVSFNVVSMVVLYYFKIMAAVLLSVYLNTIIYFFFLVSFCFILLLFEFAWKVVEPETDQSKACTRDGSLDRQSAMAIQP